MATIKRTSVLCVGMLALALLIWCWWPAADNRPSVRLPPGVSLAEALRDGKREPPKGWHTNIYGQGGQPIQFATFRDRAQFAVYKLQYQIHEWLGRSLARVPSQPTVDYVTPRLGECFDTSGEKYWLAKEFHWEVDRPRLQSPEFAFLAFVWGGTNQLRHDRERVSLIEDGIVNHGIFGIRLTWSLPAQHGVRTTEYFPTNRCAIIRDIPGMVKIVPLDYLKAYADAGLVALPNNQ
jgi:hypothetical protein